MKVIDKLAINHCLDFGLETDDTNLLRFITAKLHYVEGFKAAREMIANEVINWVPGRPEELYESLTEIGEEEAESDV